jgi:hypothetical protein
MAKDTQGPSSRWGKAVLKELQEAQLLASQEQRALVVELVPQVQVRRAVQLALLPSPRH